MPPRKSTSGSKTRSSLSSTKKKKIAESHNVDDLQNMAHRLRIHSLEMTEAAGSGHPSSCSSIAEIMAALFFDSAGMRYDPKNPQNFNNDRLVLSKGHAAPILYAAWAEAGFVKIEDLKNLRKIDSDLEGHPTPKLPFVDIATGSLGQGLSAVCGMAYSAKYFEHSNARFYCIIGDGEMVEGSVWEALFFASKYSLDNITAIFDINRLGQSEEAPHAHDTITIKKKLEAFGWNTSTIDGHDISDIINSLEVAKKVKEQPTAIIAKTVKGKYFGLEIENQLNWHGKPLGTKNAEVVANVKGMITKDNLDFGDREIPEEKKAPEIPKIELPKLAYKLGDKIATRFAYGTALKGIGSNELIVGLDGDTKNSTYALTFKDAYPDRFIECYIAEQNLVGVAAGLGARHRIPFASTFGAFFTRAYDFIRMCAISQSNIKLCGSHSGVSIGEDGPSQMALEDLAMFRAVANSVVLYPSDAVSCERAVELAANHKGTVYIRTSRPATPVIFDNEELFEIGKSKVVKKSETDKITVVAAGITLYETSKASEILAKEGINIRIVDIFSVKPVDHETILQSAKATNGLILTVEDHYPEGGIRDAVSSVLESDKGFSLHSIAVQELPRSGKPEELIEKYGLSASKIAEKIRALIKQ